MFSEAPYTARIPYEHASDQRADMRPVLCVARFSRPELEGRWRVDSLVDEEAPCRDAEFHQQE
ncbi:hypothetical protein C0L86_08655 [Streptomyces sp. SCA2-2]|nr:hypothetical protein C0L86_08655 [Streptomyces sp. SCA2-2]